MVGLKLIMFGFLNSLWILIFVSLLLVTSCLICVWFDLVFGIIFKRYIGNSGGICFGAVGFM